MQRELVLIETTHCVAEKVIITVWSVFLHTVKQYINSDVVKTTFSNKCVSPKLGNLETDYINENAFHNILHITEQCTTTMSEINYCLIR